MSTNSPESQISDYLDPNYYETVEQGTTSLHIKDQNRNIRRLMDNYQGKKILDVGAGSGKYSILFAEDASVVATDFSPVATQKIKQNVQRDAKSDDVVILQCRGENLPFQENSYDIVVALDFVEHISYRAYTAFLSEAYRVLNQDGLLCIYTPNRHYFWEYLYQFMTGKPWIEEHIGLLDIHHLLKPSKEVGFQVDFIQFYPGYVPLVRSLEKVIMGIPKIDTFATRRLAVRLKKPS